MRICYQLSDLDRNSQKIVDQYKIKFLKKIILIRKASGIEYQVFYDRVFFTILVS